MLAFHLIMQILTPIPLNLMAKTWKPNHLERFENKPIICTQVGHGEHDKEFFFIFLNIFLMQEDSLLMWEKSPHMWEWSPHIWKEVVYLEFEPYVVRWEQSLLTTQVRSREENNELFCWLATLHLTYYPGFNLICFFSRPLFTSVSAPPSHSAAEKRKKKYVFERTF